MKTDSLCKSALLTLLNAPFREYDDRSLNNHVIYEEDTGIKSIAINPVRTEQIAAAVSGEGVKLFDLRNMNNPFLTFASGELLKMLNLCSPVFSTDYLKR